MARKPLCKRTIRVALSAGCLGAMFLCSQALHAGLIAGYLGDFPSAQGQSEEEAFVLGPTIPGKWGSPIFGTGATVTWSLMPSGVNMGSDSSSTSTALEEFLPAGFKKEIERAFRAWSSVANITFVEVIDYAEDFNTTQQSGDIRIGGHVFDGPGGNSAHGFFPPRNGTSGAGDIHLDVEETWKLGFGGSGYDVFQVLAHEIGHAIGLGHDPSTWTTLMDAKYTESFSGLQAGDIAGARFLYGPAITPLPMLPVPEPGEWLLLSLGLFALVHQWFVFHRKG